MSQQELAERLYVTKGNVSGLLDRMVEAGLVERALSPATGAPMPCYLTAGARPRRAGHCRPARLCRPHAREPPAQDLADLERIVLAWRDRARADAEKGAAPDRSRKSRIQGLTRMFDAVAFAGGGNRCYWQGGFWEAAAPLLGLRARDGRRGERRRLVRLLQPSGPRTPRQRDGGRGLQPRAAQFRVARLAQRRLALAGRRSCIAA